MNILGKLLAIIILALIISGVLQGCTIYKVESPAYTIPSCQSTPFQQAPQHGPPAAQPKITIE